MDTSAVLERVALMTPSRAPPLAPSARAAAHPDIRFFQQIKARYHFAYHRTKRPADAARRVPQAPRRHAALNPHSRRHLLERIATFSASSWRVPPLPEPHAAALSALACARKGWRCRGANTLECTYCGAITKVAFAETLEPHLAKVFERHIRSLAHRASCLWRLYETPVRGVYERRPFLAESRRQIEAEFAANLHALSEAVEPAEGAWLWQLSGVPDVSDDFVAAANALLSAHYYRHDQENSYYQIDLPRWMYRVAAMGWTARVVRAAAPPVITVVCRQCNARVLLQRPSPQAHPVDVVADHHAWCCNVTTPLASVLNQLLTAARAAR
jgi:hypothetical protein